MDEAFVNEVRAWVEQPEEWDRERVYLADMGYVPEDIVGVRADIAPSLCPPRAHAGNDHQHAGPCSLGMSFEG